MTEDYTFSYTAKTKLKNSDLSFIGQVKKHAKNLTNIPRLTAEDVHYIEKTNLPENYIIKNCFELDLNAAFWNFAHQENFITDELHKKGLTMPKKTRLISLGALAKKITVMRYTGERFMPIEFIRSEDTQGVFFKVAQLTSELMTTLQFLVEKDFLFFWCDAIFVKNEAALNICMEYLQAYDYNFKTYKIDLLKYTDGALNIVSRDYSEKHPENKFCVWNRIFTFEPPRKRNNTYKFFDNPLKNNYEKATTEESPEETETGEEETTPF